VEGDKQVQTRRVRCELRRRCGRGDKRQDGTIDRDSKRRIGVPRVMAMRHGDAPAGLPSDGWLVLMSPRCVTSLGSSRPEVGREAPWLNATGSVCASYGHRAALIGAGTAVAIQQQPGPGSGTRAGEIPPTQSPCRGGDPQIQCESSVARWGRTELIEGVKNPATRARSDAGLVSLWRGHTLRAASALLARCSFPIITFQWPSLVYDPDER